MKKYLMILPGLLAALCCGIPVQAEEATATITFQMEELPQELEGRTVVATVGTGPSDADAQTVLLNGMNRYTESVAVPEGSYYCTAAVQYDPTGDYPLREKYGQDEVTVEAGNEYILTYTVDVESWYQSVTGQERYYATVPTEEPPAGYDVSAPSQISAYLTAPDGFDHHAVAYLENLYTGTVYTLDLYRDNLLAAVNSNAEAGKYQVVGVTVTDDAEGRYLVSYGEEPQATEQSVDFQITILDSQNPERKLTTPSRDNNETVQQAEEYNAEPTPTAEPESTPVPAGEMEKTEPKATSVLSYLLDVIPFAAIGIYLLWRSKRGR